MVLLIFLGANFLYDGKYIEFFLEFIPQIVFFLSTFGYMVLCIVIKWLTNWEGRTPPSIITIFVKFFEKVKTEK